MARLDGKVALITGAGSGIGFATALRFAREGAVVVGLDLRACPTGSRSRRPRPRRTSTWPTCATPPRERCRGGRSAQARPHRRARGRGGHRGRRPVHLICGRGWQRVQDVNLTGTFFSAKAVLPSMLARRSGSIVTIASVEGIEGAEGGSTYNASKGGVILLTKNMAMDYGAWASA